MDAAFKEVQDALYDLLDAQTAFKSKVAKNDFSKIYDTGDSCLVLRPSSFTSADDAFGGVYAVVWDIIVEIYEPYRANIGEIVESLIDNRDVLIDLIHQKMYLGKGQGNSIKIQAANIIQGGDLTAILADDGETITHLMLPVLIRVDQQRSVTLET